MISLTRPVLRPTLLLLLTMGCESTADLGGTCACDAACPEAGFDGAAGAQLDASEAGSDVEPDAPDVSDAPTDEAQDAPVARRYVFVTRATYVGDFGGLAAADFRCQSSATAAGLGQGWKAWLSDEVTDAADRFTSEGPRYEVGSEKLVFENLAGLRGYPLSPTRNDELGDEAPDRWWTGTLANGVKSADHCLNWTTDSQMVGGMTGMRISPLAPPGPEWTEDDAYACVGNFALLCVQD